MFQLASDLHLEFWNRKRSGAKAFHEMITPSAKTLVLCGDITPSTSHTVRIVDWFTAASEAFERVLWVPGNHEFYGASYQLSMHRMRKIASMFPNVHVLNRDSIDIDGIRFLGVTMWSPISLDVIDIVWDRMNDYSQITWCDDGNTVRGMTPHDTNRIHTDDLAWLDDQLTRCRIDGIKAVVLTHHVPTLSPNPKQGYEVDVSDMVSRHNTIIIAWCFGHRHTTVSETRAGLLLACNPHGYMQRITKHTLARENVNYRCDYVLNTQ